MEVILSPAEGLQVGLPISVIVSQSSGVPKVKIEGLGEVPLKKGANHYSGEFWTASEGTYQMMVVDSKDRVMKEFKVDPFNQLKFSQEFFPFFIGTVLLTYGVFKWGQKTWKSKDKNAS